jgi:parvulin-like peptidyl-prolyl isomerase
MKRSAVLVRRSAALVAVAAALAAMSASSRAEVVERLVAKVNGDIVTQSEFEARQLAAVQAAHIPADQVESYLRQNNSRILQEAIDDLLIVQRAAEIGIKLRPQYLQDIIDGIKKDNNIPDDGELRRQLRREGMTLDDLKRNIERSVLRRQVLSHELEPKVQVSAAEARAEYEKNKAQYAKAAAVHLQEIVVPDAEQAGDVARRARGGEDFQALARAVSTAGSRAAGGDLGRVVAGDMNPELAKVVSGLAAGGVSDPIETDKGYRVIRLVSKEEASIAPFEEVKDDIMKRLSQQKMASAYEDYIAGLRKASEKSTRAMVSEVSLTVPNVPTTGLAGAGLERPPGTPAAAPGPEATPAAPGAPAIPAAVPAMPGIDPSEISTTPQARPERVAPPPLPGRDEPSPSPSPSPSPQG